MCGRRFANGRNRRGCRRIPWRLSGTVDTWSGLRRSGARKMPPPCPATHRVMPRYAFKLRIKPEAIEEYEREHQHVWPELLGKLKEVGISDYSIFRRGQDLTLCLSVDDFDRAW